MSETILITGGRNRGTVVHTDPECPHLKVAGIVNEVSRQRFPNRPVCKRCSGELPTGGPPKNPRNWASGDPGTCGPCGGSLTAEDHTACICEDYEEVMGPYA